MDARRKVQSAGVGIRGRVAWILLVAAVLVPSKDASAWWNTTWSHRRKLTFDNSGQPENLMGFQVLVVLNGARIDYAKTRDDGYDLRFVDSNDQTLLSYEIEKWDESGNSYVWVRIPQIDSSSNADFIWMYYGNPAAPNVQNPGAVWAGYSVVHHFQETSGQHFDSTANANHSSVINVQTQASPLGIINGADIFAGSHKVEVPDSPSLDMASTDSFLVETWVNTSNAGDQMAVSKESQGTPGDGEIQLWTSSGNARFWLNDGASNARADSATNVADGQWHYLVGRWNDPADTAEVFVDGTTAASATNSLMAIATTGTPLTIGEEGDASGSPFNWDGMIDEVRISKGLRSDHWIRAQNKSMRDNAFVLYGPEAAHCCGLGVTETATTITINGPNRFDMRFNTATGGGIDRFIDSEESTGTDLSGGNGNQQALFSHELSNGSDVYTTGANSQGVRLELLEATPVRVRVRQEAAYANPAAVPTLMSGTKGIGDYSVYGVGRIAIGWEARATVDTPSTFTQLQFTVPYTGAVPFNWTGYSQTAGPFASPFTGNTGPATDAFVLAQSEQPSARTDFLAILSQNWAGATNTTFAERDPDDWEEMTWTGGATTFFAGTSTRWRFLAYLKPTNLASNADTEVTSRANDYRGPSATVVAPGSGWVDANENTNADPANVFFNEAEDAYVFETDPSTGLTLDMNGSVTTRHYPFFKIRRWHSQLEAPTVTFDPDGPGGVSPTALLPNVDFRSAVKPLSRAHYSNTLTWHCTLDDNSVTNTCTGAGIDLDVGSGGGVSNAGCPGPGNCVEIVNARYGFGAKFDANSDYLAIPSGASDFSVGGGALEFWYQPNQDHTSGPVIFWYGQNANDCFLFEKTGANALRFTIYANASSSTCTSGGTAYSVSVPAGSYSWRAKDWVHLRTTWSSSFPGRLAISMNGVELAFNTGYSAASVTNPPSLYMGGCSGLGCPLGSTGNADGLIDEPSLYFGPSEPQSIAHGGLLAAADEYLADGGAGKNFSLNFAPVDGSRRGRYAYFGSDSKFRGLNVVLATAGTGVADTDLEWQYWRGGSGAWVTLAPTDGTKSLKQSGTVSWADPSGWTPMSVNGGPDLFYVRARLPNSSAGYGTFPVERAIKTDILLFQYCHDVTTANATFAFAVPLPTRVKLQSFTATPGEDSVLLEWQTASELDNLGFHLYRAEGAAGPYRRITPLVVPGLGSSPSGARYRYLDSGLPEERTYFYELEDIETTGKTERHGPISATTTSGAVAAEPPESPGSAGITYGDPGAVSLRVLERGPRHMVLELSTKGFAADARSDGTVALSIPGFVEVSEPGSPAIPVKRSWIDLEAGRGVRLASVHADDVEVFSSLRPMPQDSPEAWASRSGAVRAGHRREREGKAFRGAGLYPEEAARLVSEGYQGETKKVLLELSPLRWDRSRQELRLSRTLRVRLEFTGRGPNASRERRSAERRNVALRLSTGERGLYGASFEELFGRRRRPIDSSSLRLSRNGDAVAFHVEPADGTFGPGSVLYFVSEGASLNPYGDRAVYELELGPRGLAMPVDSPRLEGGAVDWYWRTSSHERNRYYQAGLLEAEDLWFWDLLLAPVTKTYPFDVSALASTSLPSRLALWLQGVSDVPGSPDHRVRVSLNGTLVAESTLDGKSPLAIEGVILEGVLREGTNALEIENVGDTGAAYSMVMLDRFEVTYPRRLVAEGDVLEGSFAESGVADVEGFRARPLVLDVSDGSARWVDVESRFRVEAGRTYLMVGREAVRRPEVSSVPASRLKSPRNRADYVLIGPRELLDAAEPLLSLRRSQGLLSRSVSVEEVYSEFGFGEPTPLAVREFLSYAYHSWQKPAPRYVVLLGDATYDFKDVLETGVKNQVPPLLRKTSFLWTASDPAYAAVNGDDELPDLALGRLPAANPDQARVLVEKIVAYETSGPVPPAPVVLVADDADEAGDFGADADEIAGGLLSKHAVRKVYLSRLGTEATREAIVDRFDEGASILSYLGHGGIHLWADENVFDLSRVAALAPQPRQPIVLTMNCLNGYFHFPYFDSLAEALVKAEGRGAIAAFAPSGLSLNAPAHGYHKALLEEILSGRHARLGDAIAAAQAAYARSGAFPELLSIYHLLGDPALALR
jgi:hypothetical protein